MLMLFAIAAVVLLFLVGAAVEVWRWNAGQASMQAALDRSVLLAVQNNRMTDEYANAIFRTGFAGTVAASSLEAAPILSCEQELPAFSCSASASLPTALIGTIAGIRSLPLKVVATAGLAAGALQPGRLQVAVSEVRGGGR